MGATNSQRGSTSDHSHFTHQHTPTSSRHVCACGVRARVVERSSQTRSLIKHCQLKANQQAQSRKGHVSPRVSYSIVPFTLTTLLDPGQSRGKENHPPVHRAATHAAQPPPSLGPSTRRNLLPMDPFFKDPPGDCGWSGGLSCPVWPCGVLKSRYSYFLRGYWCYSW